MDNFEAVETRANNHVAGWVTTTDSAKLWVDIRGRGRPILFIHGWTMSSSFWRRQRSLADDYQIITINLRGHGKSTSVLRGNTIPRYARDVRDIIRTLHISDAILVGWSMGGSVVMDYWQQFGNDTISGIGIVETGPYPMSNGPWNTHRYHGGNMEALKDDLFVMKQNRKGFGDAFINNMFLAGEAPSHAMKWMFNEYMKVSDQTAISIYEDYVHRDYTSVLPSISIPTMAIYGRSKHMCFGPSTGRFVAGSIPNSRFVILDKSGHLPFYEEPDLFNNTIRHFEKQLP